MKFFQPLVWTMALGSMLSCKNNVISPSAEQNQDTTSIHPLEQAVDSAYAHMRGDTFFLPLRVLAIDTRVQDGHHVWYEPFEEDSRRTRLEQDQWLRLMKAESDGTYTCKLVVQSNTPLENYGDPNRTIYRSSYEDFKDNKLVPGVMVTLENSDPHKKISVSTSTDIQEVKVVALRCTEKFDVTLTEESRKSGFRANLYQDRNLIPSGGIDYKIK
jgi:hypothetical protein